MKNTSSTKAMTKVLVKSSKTMRQQYTSTDLLPVQGKRVNGSQEQDKNNSTGYTVHCVKLDTCRKVQTYRSMCLSEQRDVPYL